MMNCFNWDRVKLGATNPILSPSQLGFEGSFSSLFGGNKAEVATFKAEPPREALTQPPVGYQTPSAGYAYGEQKKSIWDGQASPDRNPQSEMSSASSVVK